MSNIKTFCRRQFLKIPHMKLNLNPLSANFTKMVKHTQTVRRQIADKLFECV